MSGDLLQGFVPHPEDQRQRYIEHGVWDNKPLWTLITDAHPDRPAVADGEHSLTYAELLAQADALAAGLLAAGLRTGQRVVLQLPNTTTFAVVLMGVLRAGLVPVMALPAHRLAEIEYFIRLTEAVAYITNDDQQTLVRQLQSASLPLQHIFVTNAPDGRDSLPMGDSDEFVPPPVNPCHPALFLVSGGTTGLPKLIPRTHNDYRYNAIRSAQICGLTADDIYLATLPAAHNFPLACPGMLGIFAVSGYVVMNRDPSPEHGFKLIERYAVTATALVPALAQLWSAATEWETADLGSLRLLQVGGAKFPENEARAALRAFPGALQQVFGMAEGLICYTRPGDNPDTVATTQGRPMSPLDELRIVDAEGKDVGPGEEGELLVRGPYTLRGYYRAAEHNADAFSPEGFYRTGDRVQLTPAGDLIVTGRIKDVVNRGGECIAAAEIEQHLLAHPRIRQAAIVPVPDKLLGERIGAAIVSAGLPPTLAELREFLAARGLAAFKLPERLEVLATMPVTAVGKIDKKQIIRALPTKRLCQALSTADTIIRLISI
ncbi:2,3-dihydroxybenzoate-AMP ligase [Alkalilimnicola ehrlichii]|uniref:2,3-dihydroxybenzoate-AMP ligase n=1 Tax=Alkalilimnicola ehrlichii TaxID=351052 RepID=A0A3E0WSB7_9GAMM|nr:AMP-binding protein [Alkalilimnicola ehrlichii]RFA28583.1 2,3-dihydroxybenzoate-AMP ligase [Alkalilimnicola ehrlichii]RFA35748.1 2,3-dihydroxybenzoate-AMP ligase [Alkalilimnicola ehrlichii]